MKSIPYIIAAFALAVLTSCVKTEKADLVVHNATIYTLDGTETVVQAMAITDGKIVELGAERQIMNKYGATEVVDAAKQVIFPGLIDGHCHFMAYGLGLNEINLTGTGSFDEVLKAVQAYHAENNASYIGGRGWDQNDWAVQEFPDKTALDSLFPDIPVLLRRVDGHGALANQAALDLAGITASTIMEGGLVELRNGELTGILLDNAAESARAAMPQPTAEDKKRALRAAAAQCHAVGLTSVHDAGLDADDIALIQELQEANELAMRMYVMVSDKPENFDHFLASGPIKTDRLNVRSFKFYGDGALGSRGACLLKPYADVDSAHYGFMLSSREHYEERMAQALEAGFQANTHCIGDSANRLILDIYSSLLEPGNHLRWRIEHAQVVHPSDVPRFREYGVIPSIQPTHATSDMYWAGERLGDERVQSAYAFKTLYDQLGILPLGTDFPVEDISPFKTFFAATQRMDAEGYPADGYQTENALTRSEALRAMTIGPAIAAFEEAEKGTLEVGKLADFVILNRDLLKSPAEHLLDTKVLGTYVGGICVYSPNSSNE